MTSTKTSILICVARFRRRGNPDLEPEKTVAYEVGIAQQFTDDLTIDLTGFTKDIDKLVSSVHVDITNDYSYFINDIYGRVQGFETLHPQVAHGKQSGFWDAQLHLFRGERERFQPESRLPDLLPPATRSH